MKLKILAQELFSQVLLTIIPEPCLKRGGSRYARAPARYTYSFYYLRQKNSDPGYTVLAKKLDDAFNRAGFREVEVVRSKINPERYTVSVSMKPHQWMKQPDQGEGFGIRGAHPARMNRAVYRHGPADYEITYLKLSLKDQERARPHLLKGDDAWRRKSYDEHYKHSEAAVRALGLKHPRYRFCPSDIPRSERAPLATRKSKR